MTRHSLAETGVKSLTQPHQVVILFSDIVDSVAMKRSLGDETYFRLLTRHNFLFRAAILPEQSDGARVVKSTGDGFLAQFPTPAAAVRTALRFQFLLHREPWTSPQHTVRVRTAIHVGTAMEIADPASASQSDLSGFAIDMAARVMGLALPGQVLLTRHAFDDARQYVREHPACGDSAECPTLHWRAHGPYRFKGSDDEPVDIHEVGAVGIAPLTPPADSNKARRAVPAGEEDMYGWRPGKSLDIPRRDGWVLERQLGIGGYGEVWLAQHKTTHDRRVFKFCFDADRLRSIKRELTLFRLLREALGDRHDIARLYEVNIERPPFYLESEYSPLGDLRAWADAQGGIGAIALTIRLGILARIADAVAAAHSVGILHKDIKPANILMERAEDGSARPKLTDFGIGILIDRGQLEGRNITIAGFTVSQLTENESSRTGTRMYAPPEMLTRVRGPDGVERPAPFTAQGDVYALGVMLYQLVVGDLDRPLAPGWERLIGSPVGDGSDADLLAGYPPAPGMPQAAFAGHQEKSVDSRMMHEILREDIALMVDGDPARRLQTARQVADRIQTLDKRKTERQRVIEDRQASEEARRLALEAEARRARTRRAALITVSVLALLLVSTGFFLMRERGLRKGEHDARQLAERETLRADEEAERAWAESAVGRGHTSWVTCVAITPDGRWAISGSRDMTLRRWRLSGNRGLTVGAIASGHVGPIQTVAISADGKWALSGGNDAVRLWRLESDGRITPAEGSKESAHAGWTEATAISPDGKWALTGGADRFIRLWRLNLENRGEMLEMTSVKHEHRVTSVAFSTDGHWALSGSVDHTIRLWRLDGFGGMRESDAEKGNDAIVLSVAFSPDGKWALSGDWTGALNLWRLDGSGDMSLAASTQDRVDHVRSIAFTPDGRWAVSGGDDRTVRLWRLDGSGGISPAATGAGHISWVRSVAVSPNGDWVVSGSEDQVVRLWRLDGQGGLLPAASGTEHKDIVNAVAFSSDGRWALSGSADHAVRLWRLDGNGGLHSASLGAGHTAWVNSVAFSRDGRWALSGGDDHSVRLWRLDEAGKLIPAGAGKGHSASVRSVAFAPDGRSAVSGSDDLSVRIWHLDGAGGIAPAAEVELPEDDATSVVYSSDGSLVYAGSFDKCIWVIRPNDASSAVRIEPKHSNGILVISQSNQAGWLITGSRDTMVRTWKLGQDGGVTAAGLGEGHADSVRAVAISSDGTWVLSGGDDGTIKLWSLEQDGSLIIAQSNDGQSGEIRAVALSPDGKWALSGGADRMVRLWQLDGRGNIALVTEK